MASIIFDNVSKSFLKGTGLSTSLVEAFYNGSRNLISKFTDRKNRKDNKLFWALRDVCFEVKPGEAFAIVGPNGAGKSTALKLLSKVSWPTKGRIHTNGRIACLIELGAGFHPELTGRENMFLYGTIMGMARDEIKKRLDSIVEFAEFAEFLDTPVKRYSSGMYARLGFSVAIHTRPDILLVDEVLAVGDWAFQQKCYAEMKKYKKRGTTIVFVSHNMDAIRSMCEKGILLDKGSLAVSGTVEGVINSYYDVMEKERIKPYLNNGKNRAKITSARLLNQNNEEANIFKSGDSAIFEYTVSFLEDVEAPEFGFFIHRSDRLQIVSTGSADLGVIPKKVADGVKIKVFYNFNMNLLAGSYTVGAEVRNHRFSEYLDMNITAINFQVVENYSHGGITDLNPICLIQKE
ncbi:MAG: ABC transporter ATP-binding protein [Thermodesulfobacteriota bacterium]|nr:ABC transporter ATP-binding protein [Thermodesulfobacteriota bacterium]